MLGEACLRVEMVTNTQGAGENRTDGEMAELTKPSLPGVLPPVTRLRSGAPDGYFTSL